MKVTVKDTQSSSKIESSQVTKREAVLFESLENAVIDVVKSNPFLSVRQIKTEINMSRRSQKASWWTVYKILKRNRLSSKRSRFWFVRGQL